MKYTIFLIPLILSIGIIPAFAEMQVTHNWKDVYGVTHTYYEFNCRELGHGQIRVGFYPDYVHVAFVQIEDGESGQPAQRQFSYEDYNQDIVPYYKNYIGTPANEC